MSDLIHRVETGSTNETRYHTISGPWTPYIYGQPKPCDGCHGTYWFGFTTEGLFYCECCALILGLDAMIKECDCAPTVLLPLQG